jgi:hypothetical protein
MPRPNTGPTQKIYLVCSHVKQSPASATFFRLVYSSVPYATRPSAFRLPSSVPAITRVGSGMPPPRRQHIPKKRWKSPGTSFKNTAFTFIHSGREWIAGKKTNEASIENSPASSLRGCLILAPQGPAWVQGEKKENDEEHKHARWSLSRGPIAKGHTTRLASDVERKSDL